MDKKTKNKLKNLAKKQKAARERLEKAEAQGPRALIVEVITGNHYTRQLVENAGLADEVKPFEIDHDIKHIIASIRQEIGQLRDEEDKERVKKRLRSGDLTLEAFLDSRTFSRNFNALMITLAAKALRDGRISPDEYEEIRERRE